MSTATNVAKLERSKLKQLARKGFETKQRAAIWFQVADAHVRKQQAPHPFAHYLQQGANANDLACISKDVPRCSVSPMMQTYFFQFNFL